MPVIATSKNFLKLALSTKHLWLFVAALAIFGVGFPPGLAAQEQAPGPSRTGYSVLCPSGMFPTGPFETLDSTTGQRRQTECVDFKGRTWTYNDADNAFSLAGSSAVRPASSDAVQYVSANGSDSNDGLSLGTAKLTLGAAYLALPACTEFGNSYAHCGRINIGAGTYTVSSQINIASPLVDVWGASASSTQLSWTGTTGCAIAWTSTPFNSYGPQESLTHGLHNLAIINNGGAAGTCGLETFDIIGFNASGLVISGFNGTGSSCWWDNAVAHFNEQFNVDMYLSNCTVNWLVTNNNTVLATFGYGIFNIWSDGTVNGQIEIEVDGKTAGANLTASQLHWILEGGSATATVTHVLLKNTAAVQQNIGLVRMETSGSGQTGYSIDATSKFSGLVFSNELNSTDSVTAGGLLAPFGGDPTYAFQNKTNLPARMTSFTTSNGGQADFDWHAPTSGGVANEVICGLGISADNRFECKDNINLVGFWRYNIAATAAAASHNWLLAGTIAATLNTAGLQLANGETYLFNPTSSAFTGTITQATPTANRTYTFPDTTGTVAMTIASGTVTMTTAAIAAGACGTTVTVAAAGVLATDTITVAFNAAPAGTNAGLSWWATAGNVNFAYCPGVAETPAAATVNWRVMR